MAADVQAVQKGWPEGARPWLSDGSAAIKRTVVRGGQLLIVGVGFQSLVPVGNLPGAPLAPSRLIVPQTDAAEGRAKGVADVVAAGAQNVDVFSGQFDGESPLVERRAIKVEGDTAITDEQSIVVEQDAGGVARVAVVGVRNVRGGQASRVGDAQPGDRDRGGEVVAPLRIQTQLLHEQERVFAP